MDKKFFSKENYFTLSEIITQLTQIEFDTPDKKSYLYNKMTDIFNKTDDISNDINENFHNLNKIIINEFIYLNNKNNTKNNNTKNNNTQNNNTQNNNTQNNNTQNNNIKNNNTQNNNYRNDNYRNNNYRNNNYQNDNNLNITEVEKIQEIDLDTNDLFASIKNERNYNNEIEYSSIKDKIEHSSIKDEIEKDIISGKDLNNSNIFSDKNINENQNIFNYSKLLNNNENNNNENNNNENDNDNDNNEQILDNTNFSNNLSKDNFSKEDFLKDNSLNDFFKDNSLDNILSINNDDMFNNNDDMFNNNDDMFNNNDDMFNNNNDMLNNNNDMLNNNNDMLNNNNDMVNNNDNRFNNNNRLNHNDMLNNNNDNMLNNDNFTLIHNEKLIKQLYTFESKNRDLNVYMKPNQFLINCNRILRNIKLNNVIIPTNKNILKEPYLIISIHNNFIKIINNKSYGNDYYGYYSPYLMNDSININSEQKSFLIELKNNNFKNIKLDIDKIYIEEINIITIKNKKSFEITIPKEINHNLNKEDTIYIYDKIPNLKNFIKLNNAIGKFNKNIFYIKNHPDILNKLSIGDFISINNNIYTIIKLTKKGIKFKENDLLLNPINKESKDISYFKFKNEYYDIDDENQLNFIDGQIVNKIINNNKFTIEFPINNISKNYYNKEYIKDNLFFIKKKLQISFEFEITSIES